MVNRDTSLNNPTQHKPPYVDEDELTCAECGMHGNDCECDLNTDQGTGFDAEGPSHPHGHGLLTVRVFEPIHAQKAAQLANEVLRKHMSKKVDRDLPPDFYELLAEQPEDRHREIIHDADPDQPTIEEAAEKADDEGLPPREKNRIVDTEGIDAEEHGMSDNGMDPHRRRTADSGAFEGQQEPWASVVDGGAQRPDDDDDEDTGKVEVPTGGETTQGVGRSESSSDPFHRYNHEGGVNYGGNHDQLKASARDLYKEMLGTGTAGANHERYVPDEDENGSDS